MSSKDAQFQPNVVEQCVQARGRGFRLGTAGSRGILVGGPTKEIGGFNVIDFSLRQRIVRPASVLATVLFPCWEWCVSERRQRSDGRRRKRIRSRLSRGARAH